MYVKHRLLALFFVLSHNDLISVDNFQKVVIAFKTIQEETEKTLRGLTLHNRYANSKNFEFTLLNKDNGIAISYNDLYWNFNSNKNETRFIFFKETVDAVNKIPDENIQHIINFCLKQTEPCYRYHHDKKSYIIQKGSQGILIRQCFNNHM